MRYVVFLLICCIFTPLAQIDDRESEMTYAYILRAEPYPRIVFINTNSVIISETQLPLTNAKIAQVVTSNFLISIFTYTNLNERLEPFYLVNAKMGTIQSLRVGRLSHMQQRYTHSTDGKMLGVSFLHPETGYSAYLYHIEAAHWVPLLENLSRPPQLVWSKTSQQVLVVSGWCPSPDDCDHQLTIFDVADGSATKQILLSDYDLGYSAGDSLCGLSWSPSQRYIAFMSACGSPAEINPKEIYLWDMQKNMLKQLTNYTKSGSNRSAYILASYTLLWLTDNDLLIGAIFGDQAELNTQSIHLQLPELTRTVLSDKAIVEWAVNPKYGLVAAREVFNLNPNSLETSAQVTVAQLNQQTLTADNKVALSDGCNLSWSPDGEVLASTLHRTQCSAPVEAIVFYDRMGQEISRHVPAGDPTQRQIIPIGWLAR